MYIVQTDRHACKHYKTSTWRSKQNITLFKNKDGEKWGWGVTEVEGRWLGWGGGCAGGREVGGVAVGVERGGGVDRGGGRMLEVGGTVGRRGSCGKRKGGIWVYVNWRLSLHDAIRN